MERYRTQANNEKEFLFFEKQNRKKNLETRGLFKIKWKKVQSFVHPPPGWYTHSLSRLLQYTDMESRLRQQFACNS